MRFDRHRLFYRQVQDSWTAMSLKPAIFLKKTAPQFSQQRSVLSLIVLLACAVISCSDPPPALVEQQPITITISADGQTDAIITGAPNVRQLLADLQIEVGVNDEVSPPQFTPLTENMNIRIVRVTESIELIERSIPFQRKTVRNEAMSEDDPARILQVGKAGLEELTVRIVYRDGIETERRVTQVTTIEESQDEIVMVGLGGGLADNVSFEGIIAYIAGGGGQIMRGSTALPEPIDLGGEIDRRVFSLSPSGTQLLYTRVTSDTESFNSLWVISTARDAQPRQLNIDNVLWADWNPSRALAAQIAFTTGKAVDFAPGWEANNDLWIGDVFENQSVAFEPTQVVDSYPATYGWWGGNYRWSPTGTQIAYSYADEVGLIDLERPALADEESEAPLANRESLIRFPEYNTRADWVWVPTLTWSPDGRYIVYTQHMSDNDEEILFDTRVVDSINGVNASLSTQVGIWSYAQWSPIANIDREIAYLKTTAPLENLRSSYTLWIMDRDGSNQRQIFPAPQENSFFPRHDRFLSWSGNGLDMVFVFNDDLYLHNIAADETFQITESAVRETHPTWAPYGAAARELPRTTTTSTDQEENDRLDLLPDIDN